MSSSLDGGIALEQPDAGPGGAPVHHPHGALPGYGGVG
eukprot:COSAG02_NODE_48551_length_333_cov_0.585470_1_plen_37_part_01